MLPGVYSHRPLAFIVRSVYYDTFGPRLICLYDESENARVQKRHQRAQEEIKLMNEAEIKNECLNVVQNAGSCIYGSKKNFLRSK